MPQQMKGGSFRGRGAKAGTAVRKMRQAPARLFRPGNPKPVVDYMRGLENLSGENTTERKDRLV